MSFYLVCSNLWTCNICLGSTSQDSEYIEERLSKILQNIEKDNPHKISAVVSDQGSNYLAARNRLQRSNPHILSINCAAHMLNLLTGDISKLPSLQTFINRAKAVVREIRKSKIKLGHYHEEYGKLRKEQIENGTVPVAIPVSLTIPSTTRWFGIRDMLYKLTRARPVLIRLSIRQDIDFSTAVRRTLKDDGFWMKLDSVYPLYKSLIKGINKIKK